MISGPRSLLVALSILTLLTFLTGFLLFRLVFPEWYFPFFPWLVIIFMLVNSGFILYFFRFLRKSNQDFIRGFILSTAIKLLIYFIMILAYVIASPRTAIPFAVTVSILYIVYTAFDLFAMLSMLKRNKENKSISPNISN